VKNIEIFEIVLRVELEPFKKKNNIFAFELKLGKCFLTLIIWKHGIRIFEN